MAFEVIPAMDLRDGQVVRLSQGIMSNPEIYPHDPLDLAKTFADAGATRLHIVDLDAAQTGISRHFKIAARIAKETSLPVQFGGGLRNMDALDNAFDHGIDRAVLGTIAVKNAIFVNAAARKYPGKIAISIDVKHGQIATNGWDISAGRLDPFRFAHDMEALGACAIIATAISHDGMLKGMDKPLMLNFATALARVPLIASGGIGDISHIAEMAKHEDDGVGGVILGKAYYRGLVRLPDAFKFNRP